DGLADPALLDVHLHRMALEGGGGALRRLPRLQLPAAAGIRADPGRERGADAVDRGALLRPGGIARAGVTAANDGERRQTAAHGSNGIRKAAVLSVAQASSLRSWAVAVSVS